MKIQLICILILLLNIDMYVNCSPTSKKRYIFNIEKFLKFFEEKKNFEEKKIIKVKQPFFNWG